jgi:DtxR family Mn-dependent transcriptional regulator
MPKSTAVLLRDMRHDQSAVLLRVHDEQPDLLRYLAEQGLVPGARLSVVDYSPFDGNLRLQVEGHPEPVVLGPAITNRISVEVVEG